MSGKDISLVQGNTDYDLMLADVNLNFNPSITFLTNYMYTTDGILDLYNQMMEEKDILKTQRLLMQYITLLSEEVSCIGIYAKVGFVVTQKSLLNMSNISYMNIFNTFK